MFLYISFFTHMFKHHHVMWLWTKMGIWRLLRIQSFFNGQDFVRTEEPTTPGCWRKWADIFLSVQVQPVRSYSNSIIRSVYRNSCRKRFFFHTMIYRGVPATFPINSGIQVMRKKIDLLSWSTVLKHWYDYVAIGIFTSHVWIHVW